MHKKSPGKGPILNEKIKILALIIAQIRARKQGGYKWT